jgi:hypothetical protein
MGEAWRCVGTRSALVAWILIDDSMPDESQKAWPDIVMFSDIHEYQVFYFWAIPAWRNG